MTDKFEKNCKSCSSKKSEASAFAADIADEREQTALRRSYDFASPVCVSTNQVYDSCRDRDCVSNARVYLTAAGQNLLEDAVNVKIKSADIIWVYTDVEPLSFNNGYYTVDLKFFVNVKLDVFTNSFAPTTVCGLTTFDKKVVLYGSEGSSKIFKSNSNIGLSPDLSSTWQSTAYPTVVVEAVNPIALSASIAEPNDCCDCCCGCDTCACPLSSVPKNICNCFDDELVTCDEGRKVLVSFGLFSIIRLERDTQLSVDAVDFCIPTQECVSATEDNPCDLFNSIRFPIDEFFPPQKNSSEGDCGCGCGCSK